MKRLHCSTEQLTTGVVSSLLSLPGKRYFLLGRFTYLFKPLFLIPMRYGPQGSEGRISVRLYIMPNCHYQSGIINQPSELVVCQRHTFPLITIWLVAALKLVDIQLSSSVCHLPISVSGECETRACESHRGPPNTAFGR